MKIALMGGAYKNSGDFLIEERSRALLSTILKADIKLFKRNIDYTEKINELNNYDCIVFAGGPLFQHEIYPSGIPFVKTLNDINIPVRILGGGWNGKNNTAGELYNRYDFSPEMRTFIQKCSKHGSLGCRDWYTMRALKNNGFKNCIMTGCPAWYDLNKINDLKLNTKYLSWKPGEKITIGISDPALPWNKKYFYRLIRLVLEHYHNANIKLFFHRGIDEKTKQQINNITEKHTNISYVDISGSFEGFHEYNTCFLHIGFRVHAHIYNLSQGNVSILINENARGSGVNHALGIEDINTGFGWILSTSFGLKTFEKCIRDYFEYIEQTDYIQYEEAIDRIKYYYTSMSGFIRNMI